MLREERKRIRRSAQLLCPYLTLGQGVLDIGSHIGVVAEQYARLVGAAGHVVCVEPFPDSCRQTIAMNASHPHVDVVLGACGDRHGWRTLHVDRDSSARNSLWKNNLKQLSGQSVDAQTFTLDSLAARVRNLRAIKVDAQGAECEVLYGGRHTLSLRSLVWQVEVWPSGLSNAGGSAQELCDLFAAHGWVPVGLTWRQVLEHASRLTRPHQSIDVVVVHGEVRP